MEDDEEGGEQGFFKPRKGKDSDEDSEDDFAGDNDAFVSADRVSLSFSSRINCI